MDRYINIHRLAAQQQPKSGTQLREKTLASKSPLTSPIFLIRIFSDLQDRLVVSKHIPVLTIYLCQEASPALEKVSG